MAGISNLGVASGARVHTGNSSTGEIRADDSVAVEIAGVTEVVVIAGADAIEAVSVSEAGVGAGFGGLAELGDTGGCLNKSAVVLSIEAEGEIFHLAADLVRRILGGEEVGRLLGVVTHGNLELPELGGRVEGALGLETPEILGEGVP